jgi:hypothetical protein
LQNVLAGIPSSHSSVVEIRATRDIWAVLEKPGVQSLFTSRERALEHARELFAGGPGVIEIRDEDAVLLTRIELREETADDGLAFA